VEIDLKKSSRALLRDLIVKFCWTVSIVYRSEAAQKKGYGAEESLDVESGENNLTFLYIR